MILETITTTKHTRMTDDEWIRLIQDCRTSGMSDKQWCEEHGIETRKLYYHIRRLTQKVSGCELPPNPRSSQQEKQDVVPLALVEESPAPVSSPSYDVQIPGDEPAVRLMIRNIQMDIYNKAEKDVILNTLNALHSIC